MKPLLALSLLFCLNACTTNKPPSTYNFQSWQAWQQSYEEEVSGKGGWLSLAGLYWLNDGPNTLGSAASNDHRLPIGTPEKLGNLLVNGQELSFIQAKELKSSEPKVLVNGEVYDGPQKLEKMDTRIAFANYEFFIIEREIGYAIRLLNHSNDTRKHFEGTRFIPFSPQWVVPAKLLPVPEDKTIQIATVYGTTRDEQSAGYLSFQVDDKTYQLEAVSYGKDTPMYVMFSDQSNGELTYDAGRYIEVNWPTDGNDTTIDFNRAYNPPCAFTNFATCPLTPRQNRLPIAISAGEKAVLK